MEAPDNIVRRCGGIATTAQLSAAGVKPAALRGALDDDQIRRIRRGFYACPEVPRGWVAAVRVGGRLAGLSALKSYGAWGGWGETIEVALPANASRVRTVPPPSQRGVGEKLHDDLFGTEVELHWRDDPHDKAWCWRVSAFRAARQIMRWHDPETAVACIETALTVGCIGDEEHGLLASGASEPMRRLVESCRRGAGSGIESIARRRLERRGLELRTQEPIEGVGRVDLAVVGTRVLIETDGFEFHSSRESFENDRRRDAEAIARGYVPLRFSAVQVRDSWAWVEATVLEAVVRSRR